MNCEFESGLGYLHISPHCLHARYAAQFIQSAFVQEKGLNKLFNAIGKEKKRCFNYRPDAANYILFTY